MDPSITSYKVQTKIELGVKRAAKSFKFFFSIEIILNHEGKDFRRHWPSVFTYTVVDYGVYTSFGDPIFLRPFSKSFQIIKDINKPLLHAKFRTDWFETVENRSDSKSISDIYIVVHGVMSKTQILYLPFFAI